MNLSVIREVLTTRDTLLHVPDDFIINCLIIALKKKKFYFKGDFYWQISGTSMGATFAPNLANLYVDHFERTVIYPDSNPFKKHLNFWRRYIDDIIIIWTGSHTDIPRFIEWLNSQNQHLKFTYQSNQHQIDFLDITIFEQNGYLCTKLFTKPTDKNTLLHYQSYHPKTLKDNLPFGQFLRIRRNYTRKEDFEFFAGILFNKLLERGYPRRLIRRAKKRAWFYTQEATLHKTIKTSQPEKVVCVTTWSPISNTVKKIINKRWHILNSGPKFKIEKPLFAFMKDRNLHQQLVLPSLNL